MRYAIKQDILQAYYYNGSFLNSKGEVCVPGWLKDAMVQEKIMYSLDSKGKRNVVLVHRDIESPLPTPCYITRNHQGELTWWLPEPFERIYTPI